MITKEIIEEKIAQIIDPTSSKTLAENDAIRQIDYDEATNKAYLLIAMTNEKDQDAINKMQLQIMKALKIDLGIGGVKIEYVKQGRRSVQETPILDSNSSIKFVAIASGKGGVGKSTVTANLALALTRLGKKVGLIDADIYGSSIVQIMEIEDRPKQVGNLVDPVIHENVQVIATSMLQNENAPLMWRGPMLGKILTHFLTEVNWSQDTEYILFDLPPGTGDVALDIQTKIPQARQIIVTTPHPSAAHVAVRAGKMAQNLKHPIIGVVENMSYLDHAGEKVHVFGEGGGEQVAYELGTELLIQLPIAQPNNGQYSSLFTDKDEISWIYDKLAKFVILSYEQ
jgi:ATP-binding protein involved in chromosome partitioning